MFFVASFIPRAPKEKLIKSLVTNPKMVKVLSVRVVNIKDIKPRSGGPIRFSVIPETGAKNLLVAHGTFDPGEGLDTDIHPESEEVYYVTSGKGTVYIGKEKKEVIIERGTVLYIPPKVIHASKNTGTEKLEITFFVAPIPREYKKE
jgi:mannose-6-phosphate isomerase-like protein (cupin superfamily)